MNRLVWLGIAPLLLVYTGLAARSLTANAIWLDEMWSISNAGGAHFGPLSPIEIIQRVATEDPRNAAPLYHLLLAGWGVLVGWTAFAARASSLLFGALAIAWTYRLGRDMVSPAAGLAAAAVLSTSAFFVFFAHELRTYMLATALVPFTVWCYWRIIHARAPSRLLQIGFVAGLVGLLYTHYLAAAAIAAITAYHILLVPRTARWRRVIVLMGAAGLLFLPWLLGPFAAGLRLNAESSDVLRRMALSPGVVVGRLAELASNGQYILLAAAGVLAVIAARQRRAWDPWFLALAALGTVLAANALFYLIAPGRDRYFLMLWPLLAVAIGMSVTIAARLRYRLVLWTFMGIWLVAGVQATLDGGLVRDIDGAQALPWDVLADTLTVQAQPGDALTVHITIPNWVIELRTAAYHLYGLPIRFTLVESLLREDFAAAVDEFVDDAPRLWLGLDKRLPPASYLDTLIATLNARYMHCGTALDLPRMKLDLYQRLPEIAFDASRGLLRFGDGITLTYANPEPLDTNGTLRVLLAWAVDSNVPPYVYSVGIYLMDADGQTYAQADYGLPNEALACRESALAAGDVPPGEYRLWARVYNWSSGERLTGESLVTGETGDTLWIADLQIGE